MNKSEIRKNFLKLRKKKFSNDFSIDFNKLFKFLKKKKLRIKL